MAIFWQVAFSEMQHRSFSMDHVYSVNRIRKYKSSCNFIRALCSYIIAFRLGDREWLQMHILMARQIASANKAVKWDIICCIWQQTLMEPCWISAQKLICKQREKQLVQIFPRCVARFFSARFAPVAFLRAPHWPRAWNRLPQYWNFFPFLCFHANVNCNFV